MRPILTQTNNYKWWAFSAIAIGAFLTGTSITSSVMILPTVSKYFSADLPLVQWVVLANVLTASVLLLPMGRLSDITNRRQVYLSGLAVFVVASAVSGFSSHLIMMIVGRTFQGAGAAMIQATMTAMIVALFPERDRGKAIGAQVTVLGAGMISGPALGALLSAALGWRFVFLINVPLGIIGLITALIILDKSQFEPAARAGPRPGFDWLGAVLFVGALLLFLVTISMGNRMGWNSGVILFGLALSSLFFVTWIWWQLRATFPMLDLRLLKRRLVAAGVAQSWLIFTGTTGSLFLFAFYLEDVLLYSPLKMGLVLLAPILPLMIFGPISGRLSDRFGTRIFIVIGGAMQAAFILFFGLFCDQDTHFGWLVGALVVGSIGAGLFQPPNQSSVLGAVEPTRHGVVSSLSHLTRNSGNVMGVALATVIVGATMGAMGVEPNLDIGSAGNSAQVIPAFMSGAQKAWTVLGCLMLVGTALSIWQGRQSEGSMK